jgi:hypothetical protein
MFEKRRRLALMPVLVANAYSMYGVLFLHWRVSDLFFWFWCEFVLAGIILVALTSLWARVDGAFPPTLARFAPLITLVSFLWVLMYASMFTAIAFKGEWRSWDRFPEFFADKRIGLVATILSFAIYFAATLRKPKYGLEESRSVSQQFGRRSLVISGIYLILIFHYHFTGASRLDLSSTYLKMMAVSLLVFKLIAELGAFDRFFGRQPRQA